MVCDTPTEEGGMANVAWKTINGYGPYAYLQQSLWQGNGKVVSQHIAYLGKLGTTSDFAGGFRH